MLPKNAPMSTPTSTAKVASDLLTQLSNVLPTGTFLVFQLLAPLATNNGVCGHTEVIVTAVTLFILSALCGITCYTDSYKAENGTLYYGIVTPKGLWNPNFRHLGIQDTTGAFYMGQGGKYKLEPDDFLNSALSVVALATISLLTAPVTSCFYPNLAGSIQKTVPLVVGLVVSVLCAFGTSSRNGIGFSFSHPSTDPRLLVRTSSTASAV